MMTQRRLSGLRTLVTMALAVGMGCVAGADDGDGIGAEVRERDEPSTYDRVESEVDRGTGRIVDEQTYEIDRTRELPNPRPVREGLEEDRDRQERIDRRNREIEKELELDRLQRPIEGQPIPEAHAGAEARLAPPTTQQAQDRAELVERITRAVLQRDDQIERITTDTTITDAEKRLQRVRVMYDFERKLREILEGYEIKETMNDER